MTKHNEGTLSIELREIAGRSNPVFEFLGMTGIIRFRRGKYNRYYSVAIKRGEECEEMTPEEARKAFRMLGDTVYEHLRLLDRKQ